MTGGSAPKRRGTIFEREVRKDLEARGYVVVRSGASLSPMDLVAIFAGKVTAGVEPVLLVQCKKNGRLDPDEWNELFRLAWGSGTSPMLAERVPRKGIYYWELVERKQRKGARAPKVRVWDA